MNGEQRKEVSSSLKEFLKTDENDIEALMKNFLTVDDSNFSMRYDFFYKIIASKIRLYPFKVGDTINLRSYTRSGFLKTVPLKIYGTYQFSGLESSDLAGVFNFVDMVSYRELYGRMSSEGQKELEELRKEVDLKPVEGASLEDALFGSETALETRSADSTSQDSQVQQPPACLNSNAYRRAATIPKTLTPEWLSMLQFC